MNDKPAFCFDSTSNIDMARLLKISHFTLVVGSEKRLQDGHIVGRPAHDVQHLGHPLPLHSHAFRSRVHGLAAQHTVNKLDIPNFFPEIQKLSRDLDDNKTEPVSNQLLLQTFLHDCTRVRDNQDHVDNLK